MAGTKKPKKAGAGRVESGKLPDKHAEQCTVCKHAQKREIEARYMAFEPSAEVASDYGLSHDAIDRHARYYELGVRRIQNTEKVLESLVERGMRQITNVPLEAVLDSVRELHKIRGKYQKDRDNEQDAARRKADYENLVERVMTEAGIGRPEAISRIAQYKPEVNEYVN